MTKTEWMIRKGKPRTRPMELRFWEKVSIGDPNDCWIWLAATAPGSYGVFWDGHSQRRATHVSWEISNKVDFPIGMFACHKCDNPRCVNPNHLFVGSQTDNLRDMHFKGRGNQSRPGELNGRAILTEVDVVKLRKLYSTGCYSWVQLARIFGVSKRTIGRAIKRQAWQKVI